jgi:dTDP-L-rhamnose 4-epimerase
VNILLTGGAGFIGSHTADALVVRGHSVRVLDCLEPQIHGVRNAFPDYMSPGALCIRGDIRNMSELESALEDVDVVYHFAAHTGVGQSMYALRSYVDTNCAGTAALLEAIIKPPRRVKRIILSSSRAVYGEGAYHCAQHGLIHPGARDRNDLEAGKFAPSCPVCRGTVEPVPTQEDAKLRPVSVYGWTKLHQEQLCQHVADTQGLELVMLRYFNVIGSRQSLNNPYTGILTAFYNRVAASEAMQLYERGLPIRDFVHVSDIVAANLLALEAQLPSKSIAINVGSGFAATIRELANEIANACGQCPLSEATERFRVGDIFACTADLERARSVLGYAPTRTLEQSVEEFVAWARLQPPIADSGDVAVRLIEHGLLGGGPAD